MSQGASCRGRLGHMAVTGINRPRSPPAFHGDGPQLHQTFRSWPPLSCHVVLSVSLSLSLGSRLFPLLSHPSLHLSERPPLSPPAFARLQLCLSAVHCVLITPREFGSFNQCCFQSVLYRTTDMLQNQNLGLALIVFISVCWWDWTCFTVFGFSL